MSLSSALLVSLGLSLRSNEVEARALRPLLSIEAGAASRAFLSASVCLPLGACGSLDGRIKQDPKSLAWRVVWKLELGSHTQGGGGVLGTQPLLAVSGWLPHFLQVLLRELTGVCLEGRAALPFLGSWVVGSYSWVWGAIHGETPQAA